MASRGGRGGRGRGGASQKPQVNMGHLQFAEVMEMSKQGTDVLYPPMDPPDTTHPDADEERIAHRFNALNNEMKFTPFWTDAPSRASKDIERYSDRFKSQAGRGGAAGAKLVELHASRRLDRELFPTAIFDTIIEKKKRLKATTGANKKIKLDNVIGDENAADGPEVEGSGSELEEDPELLDEDEEEEENDYEDNYFDNGEDEGDGDALGGGGGGDDGGDFE